MLIELTELLTTITVLGVMGLVYRTALSHPYSDARMLHVVDGATLGLFIGCAWCNKYAMMLLHGTVCFGAMAYEYYKTQGEVMDYYVVDAEMQSRGRIVPMWMFSRDHWYWHPRCIDVTGDDRVGAYIMVEVRKGKYGPRWRNRPMHRLALWWMGEHAMLRLGESAVERDLVDSLSRIADEAHSLVRTLRITWCVSASTLEKMMWAVARQNDVRPYRLEFPIGQPVALSVFPDGLLIVRDENVQRTIFTIEDVAYLLK